MNVTGVVAPLVTPFTDDASSVSEVRIARLVRWHREQGADALLVGSDAAEPQSLSLAERKQTLDWVVREARNLPVYVNITAFTTAIAVSLGQDANECGAVGAILSPPLGNPLTDDEIQALLAAVRRHAQIPCAFVDPSGTHSHFAAQTETPGNVTGKTLAEKNLAPLALSSHGSTLEAWFPMGIAHPAALLGANRARAAFQKWDAIKPVFQGILRFAGPARLGKYAIEASGLDLGPLRGPYLPLATEGRQVVDNLLKALTP